jgi:tRNA modification GTPase
VLELNKQRAEDLVSVRPYLDRTYFVFNKLDRSVNSQMDMQNARNFLREHVSSHDEQRVIFTSSLNGQGIQDIRDVLERLSSVDIEKDEALITQHRHFAHLSSSFDYLNKARQLIATSESYDLIALEVQSALKEIFAVLGKEFDEQVLDQVFKQFCIGK